MLFFAGRTATATLASLQNNPGPSTNSAASLPMYSYDDFGVPQPYLPNNNWSFLAPTSNRFLQDDMSQYLFQPDSASTNVVLMVDENSYNVRLDPDELVAGADATGTGVSASLFSQLDDGFLGDLDMGFSSAQLLQQLGNGDQLTEVPANDFNIIFNNDGDAAAALEQLIEDYDESTAHLK
jgi:hypothetical protein